jgi:DNA uptake protein ComE-like DNA-binding protein
MRKAGWFMAVMVICAGGTRSQKKPSDKPTGSDAADKAAFEAVCGACHPASMASDLRSESDWTDTVDVMVKAGAKGTGEQFDALLRYLRDNLTKVNVNTATAEEIAPVLAVSEATARDIVKRRTGRQNNLGYFGEQFQPGNDPFIVPSQTST